MSFSPRSRFQRTMWTITILVSVMIGCGIVLLLEGPRLAEVGAMQIVMTVSPVLVAASSTNRMPSPTTLHQVLTPASASASAANTPEQQVTPPTPSSQPVTPTVPEPTPDAAKPRPTAGLASAEVILLQVAQAETALRRGQLEATIIYGAGPRSSAQVRFDLGDGQRMPRFHIRTTYEGSTSAQTTERITIGDQSWERQQDNRWIMMPAQESVLNQLQAFLSRTDSIADLKRVTVKRAAVEDMYMLGWYDAARDADVTLLVDAASIPRQLRRLSRANGLVLTVTYSGWNTTVEIKPPDGT